MYIWVCLSYLPFCLFQIGTGFKDEDLEQHYKFLKVKKRHGVTGKKKKKSHLNTCFAFFIFLTKKIKCWAFSILQPQVLHSESMALLRLNEPA